MLTLDECIAKAPINLVFIGTETELVDHFQTASQTYELDKVNVEFARTGRQALEKALRKPHSKPHGESQAATTYVYGLVRYMNRESWSIAQKLTMMAAFAAAGLELADDNDCDDEVNGALANASIHLPRTQTRLR